jgi:hypothetical protein
MRVLVTAALLAVTVACACARDVRVFIAPRTSAVPRSGKVLFDIYWINSGFHPGVIPAVRRHSFSYVPHGRDSSWAGVEALISSHPAPDRRIAPRSIVRDTATVDFDVRAAELLEVRARFSGDRSRFESNSVVLRVSR